MLRRMTRPSPVGGRCALQRAGSSGGRQGSASAHRGQHKESHREDAKRERRKRGRQDRPVVWCGMAYEGGDKRAAAGARCAVACPAGSAPPRPPGGGSPAAGAPAQVRRCGGVGQPSRGVVQCARAGGSALLRARAAPRPPASAVSLHGARARESGKRSACLSSAFMPIVSGIAACPPVPPVLRQDGNEKEFYRSGPGPEVLPEPPSFCPKMAGACSVGLHAMHAARVACQFSVEAQSMLPPASVRLAYCLVLNEGGMALAA